MNKNSFNSIFIDDEKETFKRHLQSILEKVENDDFDGIYSYTEFLYESALKLSAYECVKKVCYND